MEALKLVISIHFGGDAARSQVGMLGPHAGSWQQHRRHSVDGRFPEMAIRGCVTSLPAKAA